jgi:hypothetical protein
MGILRRFFCRRFYGIIGKQGKLVEMHPYRHTAGFAPAKCLHRLLPTSSLQSGVYECFTVRSKVASKSSLFPKVEKFVNGRPERNFSMPKNRPGERGMIAAMPADYIVRCDLV